MAEQEKQNMIDQVNATMVIENMPLTQQARNNLIDVVSDEKTADQMAEKIKERYVTI